MIENTFLISTFFLSLSFFVKLITKAIHIFLVKLLLLYWLESNGSLLHTYMLWFCRKNSVESSFLILKVYIDLTNKMVHAISRWSKKLSLFLEMNSSFIETYLEQHLPMKLFLVRPLPWVLGVPFAFPFQSSVEVMGRLRHASQSLVGLRPQKAT